ncbi:MAG: hypothetical protein P9X26_07770 [Candidatus Stygibacter frigidus]|nr:hypothetical protein [Candidatus Stygibacter frigidus]
MEKLIQEYESKELLFEEFRIKSEILIKELICVARLNFHLISSRVKSKLSLQNKILDKHKYSSLDKITDIVGCRIITYFEDEVDTISDIIYKEFVVDADNSIDKRKIEFDRFGYLSLHFVVELNKTRLRLTEYKKFKGLKLEIQIRSILQHSWAEIEHDIGYKGKYSIPDIVKRRFSRIAALLETADLEFVRLRNELQSYEESVDNEIKETPDKVDLNKASLQSFIKNNNDLIEVDQTIANHLNIDLVFNSEVFEELITDLEFGNIRTIQDLNTIYKNHKQCIIEYSKNWREIFNESTIGKGKGMKGISIFDTAYYLIAKSKTLEDISVFLESHSKAKRCKDAFNKIESNCK